MANSTEKPKWVAQITSVLSVLVASVCPLCIPALGALLASVGLGFAVKVTFLQPFLCRAPFSLSYFYCLVSPFA